LNLPAQNRSTPAIVAALVLGLVAVFWLPYYVPVHDGISYSYAFGFNNHAAIVLLVAFALGFALWTRGLGLALPSPAEPPAQPSRWTGYTVVAFAIFAALTLWAVAIPTTPYGEAQYFLDRYDMYRMFGHPYQAFTFYYGPIMFYLPIWIAKVAHLSVPNGYYASLVIEWGLGTWVLWQAVRLAARGTTHGRAVFVICWLLLFPSIIGNGANYTPLRFIPALAFALAVERLYRRGSSIPATFGLASIGVLATLFYSPEQGLAFFVGTLLFFLLCVRTRRPGTLDGLTGFALAFAIGAVVALRMGVFSSVAAISGGALDFPLIASTLSVIPLLLLLVAGCVVVAGFRSNTSDHPLLYLVCVTLVSLPAGLSRSDPGHIIVNTIGAILAALVVLSRYSTVWRWTQIAVAVVIVQFLLGMNGYRRFAREQIYAAAFGTQYHSPTVEKLIVRAITLIKGNRADAQLDEFRRRYANPVDPKGLALPPHTQFMAPMEVQRRMTPLSGDPVIISGKSVYPLTGLPVVQEKIDELEANHDWPLLLPNSSRMKCDETPDSVRTDLGGILGARYIPTARRSIFALVPLCDYINANYKPSSYISPVPGYYVWPRNGTRIGGLDEQ
jgi:hypothetical protein